MLVSKFSESLLVESLDLLLDSGLLLPLGLLGFLSQLGDLSSVLLIEHSDGLLQLLALLDLESVGGLLDGGDELLLLVLEVLHLLLAHIEVLVVGTLVLVSEFDQLLLGLGGDLLDALLGGGLQVLDGLVLLLDSFGDFLALVGSQLLKHVLKSLSLLDELILVLGAHLDGVLDVLSLNSLHLLAEFLLLGVVHLLELGIDLFEVINNLASLNSFSHFVEAFQHLIPLGTGLILEISDHLSELHDEFFLEHSFDSLVLHSSGLDKLGDLLVVDNLNHCGPMTTVSSINSVFLSSDDVTVTHLLVEVLSLSESHEVFLLVDLASGSEGSDLLEEMGFLAGDQLLEFNVLGCLPLIHLVLESGVLSLGHRDHLLVPGLLVASQFPEFGLHVLLEVLVQGLASFDVGSDDGLGAFGGLGVHFDHESLQLLLDFLLSDHGLDVDVLDGSLVVVVENFNLLSASLGDSGDGLGQSGLLSGDLGPVLVLVVLGLLNGLGLSVLHSLLEGGDLGLDSLGVILAGDFDLLLPASAFSGDLLGLLSADTSDLFEDSIFHFFELLVSGTLDLHDLLLELGVGLGLKLEVLLKVGHSLSALLVLGGDDSGDDSLSVHPLLLEVLFFGGDVVLVVLGNLLQESLELLFEGLDVVVPLLVEVLDLLVDELDLLVEVGLDLVLVLLDSLHVLLAVFLLVAQLSKILLLLLEVSLQAFDGLVVLGNNVLLALRVLIVKVFGLIFEFLFVLLHKIVVLLEGFGTVVLVLLEGLFDLLGLVLQALDFNGL